ncbi:hypothetical protein D3C86_2052110 [compost metagenome]
MQSRAATYNYRVNAAEASLCNTNRRSATRGITTVQYYSLSYTPHGADFYLDLICLGLP